MIRHLLVCGVLLQAGWLAGCGGPKRPETPPTFPVTGVVTIDGKPTPMVRVLMFPTDKMPEWLEASRGAPQWANTDPDGKFAITSFNAGDGAPVGEYALFFYWEGTPKTEVLGNPDEPLLDPVAQKFNAKYMNLQKPQVPNIKVEDGQPTDAGTIELTTK